MPTVNLSPLFNDAQLDSNGNPLSGGKLFTYAAGSSTKTTTYTTSSGTVAQANPIVLNSRGEPASPIWLIDGSSYKFVLTTSGDTDPPASPLRTIDNISGINDVGATTQSEWVASGLTPTFVSATSFTLAGDQTTEFHVGRRLKTTNTAGTRYSTIAASAFGALTTVTVVNDSGTLDSGLSAVSYGINSAANTSLPLNDAQILAPHAPLAPFENLSCKQATVATATITADKVVVTNTSGRKAVLSTVSLTVNLGSAGANGLDTGAEGSSRWYYLWVIWNGATTAGLISESATAPTLPSGYTHKGLVGAMYNSSGSDLVAFYQRGREVRRAPATLFSDTSPSSQTQVALTAHVPPIAKAITVWCWVTEDASPNGATILVMMAPEEATTYLVQAIGGRGESANIKGAYSEATLWFLPAGVDFWYHVTNTETDASASTVGWSY